MDVKSRHHLRSDAVSDLEDGLEEKLGVSPDGDAYERVEFEDTDWEVVLIDGEPQVASFDDELFLTVRGANAYDLGRRLVTVDAGAISFVSDGADVMRPGITEASEDIAADDLVVVAEESHGKVLAVGRARVDGAEMAGDEGKVVDSLHHVGDELYEFTG
ncbi:RNA-binding protein [Natronobacterium gregoryi]|uniref:PUA-domain protein n=2 Tax=Natronobacterium gregoryi TaxID=44930 RepID=L0ANL8_NATGS|nr:RNA-binding protein [Natronobacterium gregoryi]AFZ74807.1 PUA-domain protein [Natronobacterium gregoryi SP2]ELY66139.1 RNA-binding protein [Natronobacterium gregoryi SP2]PLK19486.1 RNA-binding protein [Natronobacterium gregoryi SP2]SFJ43491.1 RNA-binding protein, containing PUA domain [Natronobacterium gregoryi]